MFYMMINNLCDKNETVICVVVVEQTNQQTGQKNPQYNWNIVNMHHPSTQDKHRSTVFHGNMEMVSKDIIRFEPSSWQLAGRASICHSFLGGKSSYINDRSFLFNA
jgi:hypothetical protein